MNLVSSFEGMLQGLAVAMTCPTFHNFVTLLVGWVFAPRRTVTRMIMAAGVAGIRHHSIFHRVFAGASWSLDSLGLSVFRMIEPFLEKGAIFLAIDDTLARKRGLKIFGVGMHHDPLLSSRGKAITNWGHSWVVLSVIVCFPWWPARPFALPVLFRLYLNKEKARKHRRTYRSRPELAVEMLRIVCQWRRNRRFHAIADSAYGGKSVLCELPSNCDLTSRLVKDARLYDVPPERKAGAKGRPRKRGRKLPTPRQMLTERCQHLSLKIYGRIEEARVADTEARMFAAPERPLRVVAVEALRGGRGQEAFYSTCADARATDVITWYAMRWSIEVTFHDTKCHLGFEEPQGWSKQAVERTAPVAMLLYSLIVLWFVVEGHRHYRPFTRPWYRGKRQPSFADMLATLRRESIREMVSAWGLSGPGSRKIIETLENTVTLAV